MRVYFIQAVGGGPIKIGLSGNPDRRLRSLQAGSPVELRLIGTIPGTAAIEGELHDRFAVGRLHGEWFDENTAALADLIAALLSPDITDPLGAETYWLLRAMETSQKAAA